MIIEIFLKYKTTIRHWIFGPIVIITNEDYFTLSTYIPSISYQRPAVQQQSWLYPPLVSLSLETTCSDVRQIFRTCQVEQMCWIHRKLSGFHQTYQECVLSCHWSGPRGESRYKMIDPQWYPGELGKIQFVLGYYHVFGRHWSQWNQILGKKHSKQAKEVEDRKNF